MLLSDKCAILYGAAGTGRGAAALIASDRASAMTGAAANITCGQVVD